MYCGTRSNLSSCPSLAAAVPAFPRAEIRHFRSASNDGRVYLPDALPCLPSPAASWVNNARRQTIRVKARSGESTPSSFRTSRTVSRCRGADNRARVFPRIGLVAFEPTAHSASGGGRLVPLCLPLPRLQWMARSGRADASPAANPWKVACVRTLLHGSAPQGSADRQDL